MDFYNLLITSFYIIILLISLYLCQTKLNMTWNYSIRTNNKIHVTYLELFCVTLSIFVQVIFWYLTILDLIELLQLFYNLQITLLNLFLTRIDKKLNSLFCFVLVRIVKKNIHIHIFPLSITCSKSFYWWNKVKGLMEQSFFFSMIIYVLNFSVRSTWIILVWN